MCEPRPAPPVQWDTPDAPKTYPLSELALLPEEQLAGEGWAVGSGATLSGGRKPHGCRTLGAELSVLQPRRRIWRQGLAPAGGGHARRLLALCRARMLRAVQPPGLSQA